MSNLLSTYLIKSVSVYNNPRLYFGHLIEQNLAVWIWTRRAVTPDNCDDFGIRFYPLDLNEKDFVKKNCAGKSIRINTEQLPLYIVDLLKLAPDMEVWEFAEFSNVPHDIVLAIFEQKTVCYCENCNVELYSSEKLCWACSHGI